MAYGRYVAICHPLKYSIIISHQVSQLMAAGVLGGRGSGILGPHGLCHALSPLWPMRTLPLFLWSQSPLEAVLWGHLCLWKGVVVTSTVVVLLPISLILTSYTLIFLQVLQMNSPEGRTRPWLLLFPSDCGHILLCQSHANIHEAWIFSHLCSEPGSIYVWHYPHSHAEPPHL